MNTLARFRGWYKSVFGYRLYSYDVAISETGLERRLSEAFTRRAEAGGRISDMRGELTGDNTWHVAVANQETFSSFMPFEPTHIKGRYLKGKEAGYSRLLLAVKANTKYRFYFWLIPLLCACFAIYYYVHQQWTMMMATIIIIPIAMRITAGLAGFAATSLLSSFETLLRVSFKKQKEAEEPTA